MSPVSAVYAIALQPPHRKTQESVATSSAAFVRVLPADFRWCIVSSTGKDTGNVHSHIIELSCASGKRHSQSLRRCTKSAASPRRGSTLNTATADNRTRQTAISATSLPPLALLVRRCCPCGFAKRSVLVQSVDGSNNAQSVNVFNDVDVAGECFMHKRR